MSTQDPTLRVIEAVQALRHSPKNVHNDLARAESYVTIPHRLYNELIVAYDAWLEVKRAG